MHDDAVVWCVLWQNGAIASLGIDALTAGLLHAVCGSEERDHHASAGLLYQSGTGFKSLPCARHVLSAKLLEHEAQHINLLAVHNFWADCVHAAMF